MSLNQTQYPNNSRIVSGTPAIFQDDVVLLCNTSVGPVTINLLEIPDNYWNTTWKIYIIDNSSNASVNNITINAGVGQTINNQSSVVLSTNGSSVIVRISSNNKYIVDGLNPPTQAYTTVQDEGVALAQRSTIDFQGTGVTATDNGSKTIVTINTPPTQQAYTTVEDEGVALAQRSTIDFQGTGVTATDNGSKTVVTINNPTPTTLAVTDTSTINLTVSGGPAYSLSGDIDDTGWLDLNGFNYCSSASFKPQCRRIGKQIFFRGSLIVPMGNSLDGAGGTVVSCPFSNSYDGILYGKTFNTIDSSNATNSCKLFTHGNADWTGSGLAIRLSFNLGSSVLPSGLFPSGVTALDSSYGMARQIGIRTVTTTGNKIVNLATIILIAIGSDGTLSLFPVIYNELFGSSTVGYEYSNMQRNLISNIITGENVPQFTAAAPSQYNANSSGAYTPSLTGINDTWAFSQNLGRADELGGTTLVLTGLTAFI